MSVEDRIRQELRDKDLLEAVIGLDTNILYCTTLASRIHVFSSKKITAGEGKVLFLDA